MRERLYRSRNDRMLFGVAGGMAEWLDVDPAVVRLVWALLILAGGVGLLLYIVAAIVVPEAPYGYSADAATDGQPANSANPANPADPADQTRREARQARRAARRAGNANGAMFAGIALVVLGAWFLLRRYLPEFDSSWFVPVLLVAVGLALVVNATRRSKDAGER